MVKATTKSFKDYRVPEVTVRMYIKEVGAVYGRQPIRSSTDMAELLCKQFSKFDREHMVVLNLDAQNRPISFHTVGIGGTTAVNVPVSNVFKTAIIQNAVSIVICHNHPGGRLTPSADDVLTTKMIITVGEMLGIRLLDHFILSANDYYSFHEQNLEIFDYESIKEGLFE